MDPTATESVRDQKQRLHQRITALVDALNTRIADFSLPAGATTYPQRRRVVVQRNRLRHPLNLRLAARDPARGNQRIIAWNATDYLVLGHHHAPVPLQGALAALARERAPERVRDIAPTTYYFDGILYALLDNEAPGAGRRRNTEAVGRGLVLDPNEPPDPNPTSPIRHLRFPPAALIVEPQDVRFDDDINDTLPDDARLPRNTIALTPTYTDVGQLILPRPIRLAQGQGEVSTLNIKRYGLPVGSAYAVTDFFVEGANLRSQWWALDLKPPPWGPHATHVSGRSVYVCSSRFHEDDEVRLLRPLFDSNNEDERQHVIDQFTNAAVMNNDLIAEHRRLEQLAAQTRRRYPDLFNEAASIVRTYRHAP